MRRRPITLLLFLLAAPAAAQPDTVLGDDVEHGFYLAPVVKLSEVDGEFATFAGGHLGWVINNQFVLGLAGYGLVHPESRREMGYGGLLLGAMAAPDSAIHIGARALFGAGRVEPRWGCDRRHRDYRSIGPWDVDDDGWRWGDGDWDDGETFVVAEPELLVRVNFSEMVRLSIAGGYRFVDGTSVDSELEGYTASFAIEIGKF
jgi:hypothetical protein